MKTKLIASAWALIFAVSASVAGSAHATHVAGWDFSQYFGAGFLVTDSGAFAYEDTLDANYSVLDPTNNLGTESAAYGTMYIDGSNGSSAVPVGTGTEQFVPTSAPMTQSLTANLDAPVNGGGLNPFDSLTLLDSEGQDFQEKLAMRAMDAVQVVFEADLTSSAMQGTDWVLTFGARTESGTSLVGVEFSGDGSSYQPYADIPIDTNEKTYTVVLDPSADDTVYVRLNLEASSGEPIIDNVAIDATIFPMQTPVPTLPGVALVAFAGLMLLAAFRARLQTAA